MECMEKPSNDQIIHNVKMYVEYYSRKILIDVYCSRCYGGPPHLSDFLPQLRRCFNYFIENFLKDETLDICLAMEALKSLSTLDDIIRLHKLEESYPDLLTYHNMVSEFDTFVKSRIKKGNDET